MTPPFMPEPPDGTRLALRTFTGSDPWCNHDPEWIVVERDDKLGHAEYVVPGGEGCWFGDHFECVPWSVIAPHIVEAYVLVRYEGSPS